MYQKLVESIPQEFENAESPDTVSGQPRVTEVPQISEEDLHRDPPKISPNDKSFTYTHGPTIPEKTPERRTDWRCPDGWLPTEWSGVSEGEKEAIYQEWKAKESEQAQQAFDLAMKNKAEIEQKRLAKEKEKEDKKAKKAAKLNREQGGEPSGGTSPAESTSGLKIVHLCPPDSSFLSDLFGSQCDIRPIHEISNLRSLKQAYQELGHVSHSTMFWLTLLPD